MSDISDHLMRDHMSLIQIAMFESMRPFHTLVSITGEWSILLTTSQQTFLNIYIMV